MCLIAFALNVRDDCPLLLASNRDEFWARPTLPLTSWTLPGGAKVCSGRDLQAGGTWLGFSSAGRVAMLTNVRHGAPDVAPRSRGELVTRWLAGPLEMPDWQAFTATHLPSDYGGFNLVLGDLVLGNWVWLSNRSSHALNAGDPLPVNNGWHGKALGPGIYGLSNAGLDTPWPKTRRLKSATARALDLLDDTAQGVHDLWRHTLLNALLDRQLADDRELPLTGIPHEREKQLSSPFVHMPDAGYGTRSSLIARCNATAQGGELELEEWTHATELAVTSVAGGDARPGGSARWPLAASTYRRVSMSTWGMPTSS
jgi:uncharacterized protein with NRDE domain